MFEVFAAEQQYHYDTWARDRRLALVASIRERPALDSSPRRMPAREDARPHRSAWARPIGRHPSEECAAA